jgi:uncharacterized membrane protein
MSRVNIVLGIGSILCLALLAFRIYFASSSFYLFFVWNLFLAWIPLILAEQILKMNKQNKSGWITGMLFFVWMLFFPNSPYIITDLFHLKKIQNVPLWFDLGLIISFAWNGLMIGFISLIKIQQFLNTKFKPTKSWFIILVVLFLSAFGIYLGRFERWNSWDVVTNPISLMSNVIDKFINPLSHPRTIGVTLLFTLFLTISYLTLFFLIESKKDEKQNSILH